MLLLSSFSEQGKIFFFHVIKFYRVIETEAPPTAVFGISFSFNLCLTVSNYCNYLPKSIFDNSLSKWAVLFCMYLLSLLLHDFRVPLCAVVLCSLLSLFEFLS